MYPIRHLAGRHPTPATALALTLALTVTLMVATPVAPVLAAIQQTPQTTWQTGGRLVDGRDTALRVNDIAYSDGLAYLGGEFTSLRPPQGGSAPPARRNHAAAINVTTGRVAPFDPNVDGVVHAVAVSPDGATVYLGGDFSRVGRWRRHNLAAVDARTGALKRWAPKVNALVRALAVRANGDSLLVGGPFSAVNGERRLRLAMLHTKDNRLTGWRPQVTQPEAATCPPRCGWTVAALDVDADNTSVYVGGAFAAVDGVPRNSAARIGLGGAGRVLAWDPDVFGDNGQNQVYDVVVTPRRVFLCGNFYFVGRRKAPNLAATAPSSGIRVPGWSARTDGAVNACDAGSKLLYLGGHFDHAGKLAATGVVRRHLAAVTRRDGTVTPWNPGADSIHGVYAVRAASRRLGTGGAFSRVGGQRQQGFAQFIGRP